MLSKLWRFPTSLWLVVLAYFPFLGWMSVPLTGDQKVYLSTAMEMRQHGEWLRPLLFDAPSYYKPPFQYWMTLLGWKILGFNLWGALVPSALALVATAWLLGRIAMLLGIKKQFTLAGLWFATTLGAVTYGTTAQMEIYVCFFLALSWWMGLEFLAKPHAERNWLWFYGAFLVAGISALNKSPLYSVFWGVGYVTYLVIMGEWEVFRRKELYLASLLGGVVGLAWFAIVLIQDGGQIWSDYAIRETWNKKDGNDSTFFSLWIALLYFSFPLTLMALPAIKTVLKSRRGGQILAFAVSWAWAPALFFSLYPYRIKPYLFILVPLVALIVDWGMTLSGRTRRYRRFTLTTGVLTAAAFPFIAFVIYRAELAPLWVCVGFSLTGFWILWSAWKDWAQMMAVGGLLTVFFFRATAVSIGEWDLAGLRQAHAAYPQAQVAMLDENKNIWHELGMLSAGIGTPIRRLSDLEQSVEFLRSGGLLILSDEQRQEHFLTLQAKLMGRGDLRDIQESPWRRWKRRSGFPFQDLVTGGKASIPDWEERTQREFKILRLGG